MMKRILILMLIVGLIALSPGVTHATGTNDYGTTFSDLTFSGHQYVDDDGVITCCDFVIVQTSYEPINDGDEYLNFVIPYFGYSDLMSFYVPDQRSTLYFYDDEGEVLDSLILHTVVDNYNDAIYFVIDLDTFFESAIPADLTSFSVKLIYRFGEENSQARIPGEFSEFLETYFVYDIDTELSGGAMSSINPGSVKPVIWYHSELAVYHVGGVVYAGGDPYEFYPTMLPPDPVRPGYNFAGWRKSDGSLYEEGTTLLAEDFNPIRIFLFASWTKGVTGGDIDEYESPGPIVAFLNLLGLNSTFGKVMVYTVVLFVLIAIFVVLGMPLFAIAAMVLVITSFFIVMGWLPAYASVLFGGTALVLMFISFKSGGMTRE